MKTTTSHQFADNLEQYILIVESAPMILRSKLKIHQWFLFFHAGYIPVIIVYRLRFPLRGIRPERVGSFFLFFWQELRFFIIIAVAEGLGCCMDVLAVYFITPVTCREIVIIVFMHSSKGILNLPTSSLHFVSPLQQNHWVKIHHQCTSFLKQLGQDSPPQK